ncbi:MAG: putative selenate reductase subunit YgfK [Treponema sp.]|nr:putative selenate reductase subunit YgfK [Treponema sp.]
MSVVMRPIPFPQLLASSALFGAGEGLYRPRGGIPFLGASLGSLVGPAAGPHTQLAQNIAASYLAGGRFIELKTVQALDGGELAAQIPRPCISALDEGYNVEWSTELRVEEALEEYVKAWVLLHVLADELGLYPPGQGADFMFSMSVGYSLEGIQSKKIDSFIEGLKNAEGLPVWESCYNYLLRHAGDFKRFGRSALERISPHVSPVITLSTLHGCPREEIEGIARYLLEEKKLHVYVKCNPTLLGYERARRILEGLGYGYVSFDDRHFREDLQFGEAVEMLGRLRDLAGAGGLGFGVKMTNTLPVDRGGGLLEGQEMYMSGRGLFPLSIAAAALLEGAFGGGLPVSYSGGADFFNLPDILKTGIRPVTMATTLLKPGAYGRLRQLAEIPAPPSQFIDTEALEDLARRAAAGSAFFSRYRKSYRLPAAGSRPYFSRKSSAPLPLWDCAVSPCSGEGGCPLGQDIPRYLEALAGGDYMGALGIIVVDNPAPSITGAICDHPCQNRCTRLDYEDPLGIREAKALAAKVQAEFNAALRPPPLKTAKKAAVVGAGPAGIAAAVFLRRAGVSVTVYEKREKPYGMVQYLIPAFRIPGDLIDRDYELALKTGVEFRFGLELGRDISLEALRGDYAYTVLALGAWGPCPSPVDEGGEIIDALRFLEGARRDSPAPGRDSPVPGGPMQDSPALGKRVAVIGGGDVAMDCARLALRQPGVEAVTLVYRRTRDYMPAQGEELTLALAEGAGLLELHAPRSYRRGILRCEITRMEDPPAPSGASGRWGFQGTGRFAELPFDTVIAATGARVDGDFYRKLGLSLDERGLPRLGPGGESSIPGVYVAGDGRAGPATVAGAIADAKRAAAGILGKLGLEPGFGGAKGPPALGSVAPLLGAVVPPLGSAALPLETSSPAFGLGRKRISLIPLTTGREEAARCLSCGKICEICCDVCPNRANLRLAEGPALRQVIHIDSLCNECGNCGAFCPYGGLPYRDKFTFFSLPEDFEGSANPGFLPLGEGRFRLRLEGRPLDWGPGEIPGSPALGRAIGIAGAAMKEYGPLILAGEKTCS